MLSDLDRDQLIVPWVLWMGDMDNVDITPGSDYGKVLVPFNGTIRALEVRIPGGTASSQLIAEILRGGGVGVGTVIASSPTVAVATGGGVGFTDGLYVKVYRGETLYLIARASDADADDFTDVGVIAWTNPMQNPA